MRLNPNERRNIHTYPFKYEKIDDQEFFRPDTAALYVHVPFCIRKCHFCDYDIECNPSAERKQAYVDAVCGEIERFKTIRCFPSFRADALYLGGGTPGLLDTEQILQIHAACRREFSFTPDAEVCIEFDPSFVELGKLQALVAAGFNRVSIGVQSFSAELLRANNRSHDVADVYRAVAVAKQAGFTHVNIDILYPLVGQTKEQWADTLQQATSLEPAAITAYPIEVWPSTAYDQWFESGKHAHIPFDVEKEMTEMALTQLESAGFQRASTGGYYHPGRTRRYCRFGDYYWRTWPMVGFGVSAKSLIYDRVYTNIRDVGAYIRRIAQGETVVDFGTRMTVEQEMRRVLIRGLKLCHVSKNEFRERFGVAVERVFSNEIAALNAIGWLADLPDRLELTREGQVNDRSVYAAFYTADDLRDPRDGEIHYGLSAVIKDQKVVGGRP